VTDRRPALFLSVYLHFNHDVPRSFKLRSGFGGREHISGRPMRRLDLVEIDQSGRSPERPGFLRDVLPEDTSFWKPLEFLELNLVPEVTWIPGSIWPLPQAARIRLHCDYFLTANTQTTPP